MKMSNKVYDVLKWIAMVVLPAIGTAYAGLAVIWGFPHGEQILGTVGILETFLGTVLMISSTKYKKTTVESEAE